MTNGLQTLSLHDLDSVHGGLEVPQWMQNAWNTTRDFVQEHGPRVVDTIVPDSVQLGPFGWDIPDPFGTGGYNRR